MSKQIKNQRGSALALALFLVVIISILGISLLSVSSNSLKQVDYERKDQAVFYIAEAGVNLAKEEVKFKLRKIEDDAIQEMTSWITEQNIYRKANKLPKLSKQMAMEHYVNEVLKKEFDKAIDNGDFSDTSFTISPGKIASVNLQPTSVDFKVKIISSGTIDSTRERVVDQEIKLRPSLYIKLDEDDEEEDGDEIGTIPGGWENHTVLTSGDIVFNSSGEIHGDTSLRYGNVIFNNYSGKILTEDGSIGGNINMDSTKQSITTKNQQQKNEWHYPKAILPPLAIDPKSFLPNDYWKSTSDKTNQLSELYPLQKYTITKSGNKIDLVSNGVLSTREGQPFAWLRTDVTFNLTEDTHLKAIEIYSNRTITINVDKEVNLLVDDFDMNYGTINVTGNGKLNLYVKKFTALNSTTGFNANTADPSKVNFYYVGSSQFTLNGSTPFYATLFNQSANMSLGGSSKVYGNIISGGSKITVSGSTPTTGQYVIAPNAELIIDGSASIRGSVIADSINFTGNGRIYKGSNLPPLPPGVGPSDDFEELPNPDGGRLPLEEGSIIES
ncbi:pilus assembly PilX N-terminal domain-containing protein [Lysinibacillus sp. A4]|uniref:pilus assembly PilX N-terminal domain-containing protein n=1 Tax=Lysinibacillus sp. A4 TaxID=2976269 RepID=UPI0021756E99|nr:pilus assembly PilX N-terminal domain-containing protein [Lysinibacillus sp. A4]MCS5500502.1 pilus assembly PilX N-terminal domain-containing protein [Lysinibacillus sp. A4]